MGGREAATDPDTASVIGPAAEPVAAVTETGNASSTVLRVKIFHG
jgi:hypothetical protein